MELTGYARVGQLLIERAANTATFGTSVPLMYARRQAVVTAPLSGYGLVAAELAAAKTRLRSRDYGLAA
jgi:hypothetical protein